MQYSSVSHLDRHGLLQDTTAQLHLSNNASTASQQLQDRFPCDMKLVPQSPGLPQQRDCILPTQPHTLLTIEDVTLS